MSDNEAWATRKEVNWLKTIGENAPMPGKTRLEYLRGYQAGLEKRQAWDAIAKDWMIKTVDEMIEKELRNGAA